jgi:hypothetical protein
MPYQYPGQAAVAKRFVAVCHEAGYAICLKVTSQVTLYTSNPKMMGGVVFYTAGELAFFEADTAVQPDNLHPIPHGDILRCVQNHTLELLGTMPLAFRGQLSTAITTSVTMKPARKKHLLERL